MLEYKTKAEMSHIPQSQDAHQMTMEDSENNFQNITEEIPMVRREKKFLSIYKFIVNKRTVNVIFILGSI